MQSEIDSLKLKFKDMEERKASSWFEEGDKPHIDDGDQFVGNNQNSARRGD